MGTFETLIVFSALMMLIALVGVAIDWVGKPLRHRQFVPRMYRYDDEVPVSASPERARSAAVVQPPIPAPAPVVMTPMAPPPAVPASQAPTPPAVDLPDPAPGAPSDVSHSSASPSSTRSGSAFSDTIGEPEPEWPDARVASAPDRPTIDQWQVGLALDLRVDDRRPSMSTRAERFWRSVAAALPDDSHFSDETIAQMHQGKAPRRLNPRSGEYESMQLVGLRSAADPSEVRMHWPDDAIDPWSG